MDWEEFRLKNAKPTLSCELRALSYRKLTAGPRILHRPLAPLRFKEDFPPRLDEIARQKGIDTDAIESGSPMKSVSARKTGSPAVRRGAARVPRHPRINERRRPISLARFARWSARPQV